MLNISFFVRSKNNEFSFIFSGTSICGTRGGDGGRPGHMKGAGLPGEAGSGNELAGKGGKGGACCNSGGEVRYQSILYVVYVA